MNTTNWRKEKKPEYMTEIAIRNKETKEVIHRFYPASFPYDPEFAKHYNLTVLTPYIDQIKEEHNVKEVDVYVLLLR